MILLLIVFLINLPGTIYFTIHFALDKDWQLYIYPSVMDCIDLGILFLCAILSFYKKKLSVILSIIVGVYYSGLTIQAGIAYLIDFLVGETEFSRWITIYAASAIESIQIIFSAAVVLYGLYCVIQKHYSWRDIAI